MGFHSYEPREDAPTTILRRALDIGITEFSEKTGLSRQAVYQLEKGGGAAFGTYLAIEQHWGKEARKLGLKPEHWHSGTIGPDAE